MNLDKLFKNKKCPKIGILDGLPEAETEMVHLPRSQKPSCLFLQQNPQIIASEMIDGCSYCFTTANTRNHWMELSRKNHVKLHSTSTGQLG